MNIKKYMKLKYKEITLEEIALKETTLGKWLVVVKAKDGSYYSTFEDNWKKLKLDFDSLTEGDLVKIGYVARTWRGNSYNNFFRFEILKKALKAKDAVNESAGLSDADLEALAEEAFE